MIRALIVDDERLARQKLRMLLGSHSDVEIIGECADGPHALDQIRSAEPDLVFLDIQMPQMSGLEVLHQLEPDELPRVVFVTAHQEYAVEAFEIEALDYLLKPFDRKRFDRTLARVRRRMHEDSDHEFRDGLARLLARLSSTQRITVRTKDRAFFVAAADVDWVEAEGKYVRVHAGKQSHLIRDGIGALQASLDPQQFSRIHRGYIVNLSRVAEIHRGVGDDFVVVLKDGTRLPLSRRYRTKLRALGLDL